jgi:hypothetical protein
VEDVTFDHLARRMAGLSSRRTTLRGVAGTAIAAALGGRGVEADAKSKKKPKIKRNALGCVNVGDACTKDAQCCSNRCKGSKGKKKCQGHDGAECRVGQDSCAKAVPCVIPRGLQAGICNTTTGKAPYCRAVAGTCSDCHKDAECISVCGGQQAAACVTCATCPQGRACGAPETC